MDDILLPMGRIFINYTIKTNNLLILVYQVMKRGNSLISNEITLFKIKQWVNIAVIIRLTKIFPKEKVLDIILTNDNMNKQINEIAKKAQKQNINSLSELLTNMEKDIDFILLDTVL